ncbi:MAG: NmrA family NAD(P)-binding protein [Archangium sp.]|nr:NmrA family NAD(P)-binding protein [Archangium sp.]MDP3152173.1 NmrA family NAD(P)-binding protein [Archangium sp.]MDP3574945.1 NmrA family NAD(P)-binding protein [Archangium sp.]
MNDKLIVIVGSAGKLGRLVLASLLKQPNLKVRALVRDLTKPEVAVLVGPRVELKVFDIAKATAAERTAAVSGAFAVVSTVQGGPDIIIDGQLALLRAAKAAGARRFLPSDYSYDLFGLPEGVNMNTDWRRALATAAAPEASSTFEVVHLMQGIFTDKAVLGFLGVFDAEKGVARYWGDGKTPIDWTTWEDTARFIAAAATDERAVPERLQVAGDRMDLLTVAKTWEHKHGRKVSLERLGSLEDLEALTKRKLHEEPHNMYAWLPLMYARGVFGGQAVLGEKHNARYPGIVAETVAQAIDRGAL